MKYLCLLVFLIFLNSCGENNKNRNDVYKCDAGGAYIELRMKSKEVISKMPGLIRGSTIEKIHKITKENSKIYWKMGKGDFGSSNSFDKKTLEWVQTWNSKKLGVDRAPCQKIN